MNSSRAIFDFTAAKSSLRSGSATPYSAIRTVSPVLVLHGTGGTGSGLLSHDFGDRLFGPGQPLDAARHFIVLPDAIGHGASAKPSDGMRASFPRYNYDDMVEGQYRVVTEALGLRHLRLVLGASMGGMHTWLWGVCYPSFMDALPRCLPWQPLCRDATG